MADSVTIDLRHVARGLGIPLRQVEAVVELLDDGNTVPFITRYRKDATGGLDEEQIRQIQSRLKKLRLLAERKETILRSIESQGKLTEKLAKQIFTAGTTKRLEDLYLPFKPKKQTLATVARLRGLEVLAGEILSAAVGKENLDARAQDFVNPDRQVPTAADALLGAGHILTEQFSERADLRHRLREILQHSGRLACSQMLAEPKPASEKADRPAAGGQTTTGPRQLSLFPAETTADAVTGVGQADPLAEPHPAAWIAQPDEAVVSYDTTQPLPLPAPLPEAAPEATGPAETAETFPLAEIPADVPGAEAEIALEGLALGVSGEIIASSAAPVSPPISTSDPPAPARHATAPRSATAASRKRAKAEQLREKKEQKKKKAEQRKQKAFRDYYDYHEEIRKIPPHRILAINRGERARVLRVKVESDLEAMNQAIDELCVPPEHPHADFLRGCARDALTRLILPSLERESRRELTERAETHAVGVFARNLRNLLLVSPVRDRRVLAVDPGYKSGCKLVAMDQFGNVLAHQTIYLVGRAERVEEARRAAVEMIHKHDLGVVTIGNGTACRQTEEFFGELIAQELKDKAVCYVIVNEAGASVYSTSRLGREEFPQHDASVRGAISIGRRLQDPLSELVKIDPPNLGVGLYQHDIKANHLRESLDEVVESCVNYVGVDVNTASPALLRYVSGMNQLTARRLYEYRLEHGPFTNREQLKEVPGVGEATFVQAAGFLKVIGGDNPLDATWIHPESYPIASRVMERLGLSPADWVSTQSAASFSERMAEIDVSALAGELQVGAMLLKDIVSQLARPGRDPREDLPAPVFKRGVLKLEDLAPGMELTGTVLNVVDFGAFVDIGMHDSGLVHVSHLAGKFVRDPHDVVAVGDIVRVWVVDVDKQRRRVSLTMIPPGHERPVARRHEKPQGPRPERQPAGPPSRAPGRGRPEGQGAAAPAGRSDRPRFGQRRPETRGPRQPDRGPPKPPPRPKPITPITDDMKTGKEPLRSFSDLMQFYGLGQQPGAGEQGRGRKNQDKRNKDAARRKDQGPKPQAPQPQAEAPQSGPPTPPSQTEPPETKPPTDGAASSEPVRPSPEPISEPIPPAPPVEPPPEAADSSAPPDAP